MIIRYTARNFEIVLTKYTYGPIKVLIVYITLKSFKTNSHKGRLKYIALIFIGKKFSKIHYYLQFIFPLSSGFSADHLEL